MHLQDFLETGKSCCFVNLSCIYHCLLQYLVSVKYAVELDSRKVGEIRRLSSLVSLLFLKKFRSLGPPTAFFSLITEKLLVSQIYRLQELT